jgi:NADH-ubiquinone oxidoreductase chain 4
MIATLANMSFPLTSSFVGEFLTLVGTFQNNITISILASTGIVLGAAYSIWLYNRIIFGTLSNYINKYNDINKREFMILIPFMFLIILMGIYPDIFLDPMHVSVSNILNKIEIK